MSVSNWTIQSITVWLFAEVVIFKICIRSVAIVLKLRTVKNIAVPTTHLTVSQPWHTVSSVLYCKEVKFLERCTYGAFVCM